MAPGRLSPLAPGNQPWPGTAQPPAATSTPTSPEAPSAAQLIDSGVVALSYLWLCCGALLLAAAALTIVWWSVAQQTAVSRAMTRCPHRSRWLLLGLTWLAFALRIAGLTAQSLWRDEVDALIFATLAELLGMFRQPGQNGPLFFLALRPWLAAAGESEFVLRFPSAWAGALAVPILYALVRRLAGDGKPAAAAARPWPPPPT